jgi:UDP-N-acetyl-D-galactosamine dehydrogenase
MKMNNVKIGVVGMGYVGLPLAVEFGKKYLTIGFDINQQRIEELKTGKDRTLEISDLELNKAINLRYSYTEKELESCNIYIVTVPTPINIYKQPDLTPLKKASRLLGSLLKKQDIVIYESTVYPGATEEICVPILEQSSGLVFNTDFFIGYSPERINPGDKEHRVTNILKITSGSTQDTADTVDSLYKSIISAGTHKASSIKVAEAAKVIENTQRDVNIALINELALIFNKLGIDTEEVLLAAGTKWNFLPFRPGLVGGHCISVDPYYLTHKAQAIGYNPEIILAGRRLNDSMGNYMVTQIVKLMLNKRIHINEAKILIMGLAFKENCPDLRNTRVIDMINEFNNYGAKVDVYDPWVDSNETQQTYGFTPLSAPQLGSYDAIVLAVKHKQFTEMGVEKIRALGKDNHVLYDIKYILPANQVDGRL